MAVGLVVIVALIRGHHVAAIGRPTAIAEEPVPAPPDGRRLARTCAPTRSGTSSGSSSPPASSSPTRASTRACPTSPNARASARRRSSAASRQDDLVAAILSGSSRRPPPRRRTAAESDDPAAALTEFIDLGGRDVHRRPLPLRSRSGESSSRAPDPGAFRRSDRRGRTTPQPRAGRGSIRGDVVASDIGFLVNAIGHAGMALEGTAPGAWRRYVGLILDGLRSEGATPSRTIRRPSDSSMSRRQRPSGE